MFCFSVTTAGAEHALALVCVREESRPCTDSPTQSHTHSHIVLGFFPPPDSLLHSNISLGSDHLLLLYGTLQR